MRADPVTIAAYRAKQEHRQWVRIEDARRQHGLSDGQIIDAWRRGRISPRLDVPKGDFYDTSGECFVHLGGYPLRVDEQYIAQFSAEGVATISVVFSPVLLGEAADWNGGLLTTPDGVCMVDCGRALVLASPIKTRLGALWIGADEAARLTEQPAEEVMTEALRGALEPEPLPPKGKRLDAQIAALVQVTESMGHDLQSIPNGTKSRIFAECDRLYPGLFPARSGALHAWREASKTGIIRHNQNRS